MRTTIVAGFVVSFALTAVGGAQTQDKPKEHTMTGCLKRGEAADSYMITDVEGNGPKSVGIVSSEANLAPHVGHKIAITGSGVPSQEAEMGKNVPKAPHYMKVSGVKMVSSTCP